MTSGVLEAFEAAQTSLCLDSRTCLQLAQVIGRRWSYVGGPKVSEPTGGPPLRLLINKQWGLIIYGAEFLSLPTRDVLKIFKEFFKSEFSQWPVS